MKKMLCNKYRWTAIVLICLLVLSIIFTRGKGTGEKQSRKAVTTNDTLVIYTPHPTEFIRPLVEEFENAYGITVEVVNASSGELMQKIESEKEQPQGDILWGGSFFTMRPHTELFAAYSSVNENQVQEEFRNQEGMLTRFTDVPSVLMINTDLVGDIPIEGYEDLLNPALKGKIAYADPAGSSSSFEHLMNMLYACGNGDTEAGWTYVEALCENLDGKLLNGSSAVYHGVAEGEYVVGLTFEEAAASYVEANEHVRIVYMKEGVISTPDVVAILKGAFHMENAAKFIDFVTGYDAQFMITQHLNRRSVRADVKGPSYLPEKRNIAMIICDEQEVIEQRSDWIAYFTELYKKSA